LGASFINIASDLLKEIFVTLILGVPISLFLIYVGHTFLAKYFTEIKPLNRSSK